MIGAMTISASVKWREWGFETGNKNMARTIITKEELQKWITAEIRKYDGCGECSAGGIVALYEPDKSGCNWSDQIVLNMTGVPPEIFRPAAGKVIAEARSKFNIK